MKVYHFILNRLVIRALLLTGILMLSQAALMAQDDEAQPATKNKARISLDYTLYNNIGPRLTATIKTKEDRSYVPVPGVRVHFYVDSISTASDLGHTVSGKNGEAVFPIPETLRKRIAKEHDFIYFATIKDDPRLKDADQDIQVKRSFLDMKLEVEDSVKKVHVFLGAPDSTGEIKPVGDVEVKVYVKRLFGLLPITEGFETTNSDGMMILDFPDDIPGDEDGNLTILAKVQDHDDYGTLISARKISWGTTLIIDPDEMKGELWSAKYNSPISLVIIINTMVIGIWGVIIYVFLQIFKIKRIGTSEKLS